MTFSLWVTKLLYQSRLDSESTTWKTFHTNQVQGWGDIMSDKKGNQVELQTLRAQRVNKAGKILGLNKEDTAYRAGCSYQTLKRGLDGKGFSEEWVVKFANKTNTDIGIYSNFEISDEEFKKSVLDGTQNLIKEKSITRILPYQTERWISFLEKFSDSTKIEITKNILQDDKSKKGLVQKSKITEQEIPKFKSNYDEVSLKISCPIDWYTVITIFSNNTGWSSIPSSYQGDNIKYKAKMPPVRIPNPDKRQEPLVVTGKGIQWIIAVISKKQLPKDITKSLLNDSEVEYGVSELFVHIDSMQDEVVQVLVKRFEVVD